MVLVLQESNKISKIVVEKFDYCHKFVESTVQFILLLEDRKFVHMTQVGSCNEFLISISI